VAVRSSACDALTINQALYGAALPSLRQRPAVWLLLLAMHQYVYPMLVLRRHLPAAFVHAEFLPVGNPETRYVYGACRAGHRLRVRPFPVP
jgi:hypothetical protein